MSSLKVYSVVSMQQLKMLLSLERGTIPGFCGEPVGNPGSSAERNDGSANLVSKLLFDRNDAS